MRGIEIERDKYNWIRIINDGGGFIKSQSVEANLLFEIYNKLEEIRCSIIDVESAVGQG